MVDAVGKTWVGEPIEALARREVQDREAGDAVEAPGGLFERGGHAIAQLPCRPRGLGGQRRPGADQERQGQADDRYPGSHQVRILTTTAVMSSF